MNYRKAAAVLCAWAGIGAAVPGTLADGTRKEVRAANAVTGESGAAFFPVAVWYSGGKARAPMLEQITAESPRWWKEDWEKIKGLGFNTVRTWVECVERAGGVELGGRGI